MQRKLPADVVEAGPDPAAGLDGHSQDGEGRTSTHSHAGYRIPNTVGWPDKRSTVKLVGSHPLQVAPEHVHSDCGVR